MGLAACLVVVGCEAEGMSDVDAGQGAPVDAMTPDAAGETPDAAGQMPDAANQMPQGYVVRGVATGVLTPLEMEIVYPGGRELLSISADGAFTFEPLLEDGDSYDIALVGEPPCVLESGNGVISGANAEVVLACAGAPFLTDIVLSGFTAPDLAVSLAQADYSADMPLAQESFAITPVALNPRSGPERQHPGSRRPWREQRGHGRERRPVGQQRIPQRRGLHLPLTHGIWRRCGAARTPSHRPTGHGRGCMPLRTERPSTVPLPDPRRHAQLSRAARRRARGCSRRRYGPGTPGRTGAGCARRGR